MTKQQQKLLISYINYNDIKTSAKAAKMSYDEAEAFLQKETVIKFISDTYRRLYYNQLHSKAMSLTDIASYLSALITDDVPAKNELTNNEKLKAIQLLVDVLQIQENIPDNATAISETSFEAELQEMSVSDIKKLISKCDTVSHDEKEVIIAQILQSRDATYYERAYLQTLSISELQHIAETCCVE